MENEYLKVKRYKTITARTITLKGHEEDFITNRIVMLINLAKNKLEPISKPILDATNKNIGEAVDLNY